jgi:ribonuclease VapC
MVIDTSALTAILWRLAEREPFLRAIQAAPVRMISAVSLYETAVVVFCRNRSDDDVQELIELIQTLDIEVVPFGYLEVWQTTDAYRRYGKGIHSAGLNLVDCAAYSLARRTDLPLLFRGSDFPRTDVRPALR